MPPFGERRANLNVSCGAWIPSPAGLLASAHTKGFPLPVPGQDIQLGCGDGKDPRFPEGSVQATSCSPGGSTALQFRHTMALDLRAGPGSPPSHPTLPGLPLRWPPSCPQPQGPSWLYPKQPSSASAPSPHPILMGLIAQGSPWGQGLPPNCGDQLRKGPGKWVPSPQPEPRSLPASSVAFSVRWAKPSAASLPRPPSMAQDREDQGGCRARASALL